MQENKRGIWKFLTRTLFSHSKQVVVLSEVEKESLERFHGFSGAIILSNSIAAKDYFYAERAFAGEKPTFLFLGRLHESKGLEDIERAFVKMKNQRIAFRFILCGTGPLEQYCRNNFQGLLGEDFEFRGVVSGLDKKKAFQEADFFLLPSRYGEGLPMALLEAMASGLVPIVTDDASMKFVVRPFYNGIRVEKRNASDITKKILEVLNSPLTVSTLQRQAVETVKKSYDIQVYISKLNVIYENGI